jgi:hypothetical protein
MHARRFEHYWGGSEQRRMVQANLARLRQQRVQAQAQQKEQEQRAKEIQERDLLGERARIEYGLGALSDTKIKQHL